MVNGISVDLHLIYPEKIIPRLNRFYRAIFKILQISNIFGYVTTILYGKTSIFKFSKFIYSQVTKASEILNGFQADVRHLFLQIMCRLSNCVSCLPDIFTFTLSTKIFIQLP